MMSPAPSTRKAANNGRFLKYAKMRTSLASQRIMASSRNKDTKLINASLSLFVSGGFNATFPAATSRLLVIPVSYVHVYFHRHLTNKVFVFSLLRMELP